MQHEEEKRIYEIGINIAPIVDEFGAAHKFNIIKNRIIELGGRIIQECSEIEHISLAYPMKQIRENSKVIYNDAYFAWIKFEIDTNSIKILEKELKFDIGIIRHILFKTVEENTYIVRKNKKRTTDKNDVNTIEDTELPDPVVIPDPALTEENDEEEDIDESILNKKLDELTLDNI